MAAVSLPTQANAAATLTNVGCSLTEITPNASACVGFYSGNLIGGSPGKIADQQTALNALGFAWNGNYGAAEKLSGLGGASSVNFATPLYGNTIIGVHFGGGGFPGGYNGSGGGTAFFKFNALSFTDVVFLQRAASSNAILYFTMPPPPNVNAVPEPATWAMMLAGFGLMGAGMRRKRKQALRVNHT